MSYLKMIFGDEYEPKNISVRFENRNAFITMSSHYECETFMARFGELARSQPTELIFSLYRPKNERINANNMFKKYNNFESGMNSLTINSDPNKNKGYKSYNTNLATTNTGKRTYLLIGSMNFGNNNNVNAMNSNNKVKYNTYNNFNNNNFNSRGNIMQNSNMVNYGNNNNIQPNDMNNVREAESYSGVNNEESEKEEILDIIYHKVEQVFPEYI